MTQQIERMIFEDSHIKVFMHQSQPGLNNISQTLLITFAVNSPSKKVTIKSRISTISRPCKIKYSKFTDSQIIDALKCVERGLSVSELGLAQSFFTGGVLNMVGWKFRRT